MPVIFFIFFSNTTNLLIICTLMSNNILFLFLFLFPRFIFQTLHCKENIINSVLCVPAQGLLRLIHAATVCLEPIMLNWVCQFSSTFGYNLYTLVCCQRLSVDIKGVEVHGQPKNIVVSKRYGSFKDFTFSYKAIFN